MNSYFLLYLVFFSEDDKHEIKLMKREIKKEQKITEKELEKQTLREEYESLQTELDDYGLLGNICFLIILGWSKNDINQ